MRIFVDLSLLKRPWGLFHETPRRLLQGLGMPWGLLTLLLETRHRVFGSCKRSHPVEGLVLIFNPCNLKSRVLYFNLPVLLPCSEGKGSF